MNFFRKPVVRLLELEDERAVVLTDHPYESGKKRCVHLSLSHRGDPSGTVAAKLEFQTSRPLAKGGFLCTAQVLTGLPNGANHYRVATEAAVESGVRGQRRYRCRIRVLSPDLPGLRAVSLDFSLLGLQIQAEQKVPVGTTLKLVLEFDVPRLEPALCKARVAWCTDRRRGRVNLGLEFVDLDPIARKRLTVYELWLRGEDPSLCPPLPQARAVATPTREVGRYFKERGEILELERTSEHLLLRGPGSVDPRFP